MNILSFIKSIYFKFGFFLLLLFVLSTTSYFIVSMALSEEKNITHIINVAGRERMLTEKMNKKAFEFVFMGNTVTQKELQQSIAEFERNFFGLMNGSEQLGFQPIDSEDIKNRFTSANKIWESLKVDYDLLLIETDEKQQKILVNRITKRSEGLIISLEQIVSLIEEQGSESFKGLNTEKLILLFSNLLLVIVLFVTWRLFVNIKNSEKKYRLLIDHSPMGIMTLTDNKINFINKVGFETLGATSNNEIVGRTVYDFIDSEVKSSLIAEQLIEEKCRTLGQKVLNIELIAIPLNTLDDENEMIIFRDITQEIQSKNKAEYVYKELKNIRSALEASSIVEVVDRSGKILYVNDKFCDIAKYHAAEVIGKTHRILQSGYHSQEFYQNLWETVSQGQVWEGQIKNKAKDGSHYWVQTIIVPFINNKGEPYQFITIRNDITARKKAEREIKLLATHDHLTHLSNRRKFEYELQHAIDRNESVAILFIDLDRFKYINDSLGHSIGDKLIKLVAKRLKDIVRNDAIVSRQGGDEFTILVKYHDHESLAYLAREIIEQIKIPYNIDQKEILITCSIGISVFPEHGNDIETLMKNADVAMYWTKENGKDHFSFYQNHMKEKSARIMQLELELRKAIENEEFTLYYQPKITLSTGEIVGYEALIRWIHPTLGFISPVEFIPLAEETGLINQIGEWALREACMQNKKWHEEGYTDFVMAVNISVHQFKQAKMVQMVEQIIAETGLEARYLELEITESISMLTEDVIVAKLYSLKELGISIAIDDFGTGYSSLKYLDMIPADTLKIDKSFIDEIGDENSFTSSMMTNAIISLAKSLKMKVVAEGIEEVEQLRYLKMHNCDLGQGYLISKPLPPAELEEKFMNENKIYFAV